MYIFGLKQHYTKHAKFDPAIVCEFEVSLSYEQNNKKTEVVLIGYA